MTKRLKEWWQKLTYRQRCTIHALLGAAATPFVILHASPAFDPFLIKGGHTAVLAWIGLASIYYVTVRSWIDLITDAVDVVRGEYSLLGGDVTKANLLRSKVFPYDLVSASNVKRDWSTWQYVLSGWTYIENALIATIALVAMVVTVTQSPYLSAATGVYSRHYDDHHYFLWIVSSLFLLTYVLTVNALLSMILRNDAGVMSLPLRWLGLPNYYSGQNVFPQWLNELLIKLIGRPM